MKPDVRLRQHAALDCVECSILAIFGGQSLGPCFGDALHNALIDLFGRNR
jgi:hypothetical protein